jgi:PAS domain S-box-containing protein
MKERILIVEDERIVGEDIKKTLETFGYIVTSIESSRKGALKKAEKDKPDLVLMDIMLQGKMEGVHAAEKIRSQFGIPVVYLTAYTDKKLLEEAKITGPYGYIVKPFTNAELYTTIETALNRHRLETKLIESDGKYRDIFESAKDTIVILDQDGNIIDINKSAEHLTGFTRSELLGRNIINDLVVPDDRNTCKNILDNQRNVVIHEIRLKAKDGRFVTIQGSSSSSFSKDGTFRSICCIFRDVTERKQSEDMMRLLKEAVETLPIGITISNIEGKIVYVNPVDAVMHGYTVEELIGKNAKIFAPVEFWKPMTFDEIHGMGGWRRESINMRKNGETFPVQLVSIAVKNAEGQPIGIIMACEDITEQKRAEEELIRRQEALRSVYKMATTLGSSFKAVCDEVVLSLSEILRTSHVLVQRFLEGQWNIVSSIADGKLNSAEASLLKDVHCALLQDNQDKREVYAFKGSMNKLFPDNLYAHYDLNSLVCVPIFDRKGNVVSAITALDHKERDYTTGEMRLIEVFARYVAFEIQREEMEKKLRDAQRMEVIGKLAGGVAHEVRNPLNAIMVITEALFKDLGDDPEYKPFIFHIRSQVDRLSALMKDLLDLGKPIEQTNLQSESLNKICSSSIDIWKQSESSRSHTVKILQPPGNIFVFADSQRLQQVFINLLENATHHSPEGSEIQLIIKRLADERCKVQVIDRGSGVPEDILPRIFEPFFTTRRGGTGLGLSIVKYVIENHGGTVEAFNNEPPPGCTFGVKLPIEKNQKT